MSFKIRLEKILSTYSINPKKLGEKLGYGSNPAKLYRLLNDENNSPSFQIIQDILRVFPQINARWLIIGEEDMLLEEPRAQYGYCKECIRRDGVIDFLKEECRNKDKIIEKLKNRTGEANTGAGSQDEPGRKAS